MAPGLPQWARSSSERASASRRYRRRFAASRKGIASPIVENTDIFLAPDIEAANILYRAILYFAKGESGGIVVGAKVPLILLSRAETPETKIRSIALAMLAAAAKKP